jgi:uncharacterized protein (DUF3084 family)
MKKGFYLSLGVSIMSQEPVTVTYSLEEVLSRLEQKIDQRFDQADQRFEQIDQRFDKLEQKIDRMDGRLGNLEVGQARLEEKMDGLDKRIENQEFITRGVVVGLIMAVLAGLAKFFGLINISSS